MLLNLPPINTWHLAIPFLFDTNPLCLGTPSSASLTFTPAGPVSGTTFHMDPNGQVSQLYLALLRSNQNSSCEKLFVAMKAKRNTSAPFPITNQTLSNSSNKLKTNPSKVRTSTRKTTPSAKVQLLALHGIATTMVKAKPFSWLHQPARDFVNPKNEGMSHLDLELL